MQNQINKFNSWTSHKKSQFRKRHLSQKPTHSFRRGHDLFDKLKKTLKRLWHKTNKGSLIKNLILLAIAMFLFGTIAFLGLFAWLSKDLPDPNSLTLREVPQSTKIYDRTGEILLYEIAGDEKRTLVTLEDIPDYLEKATITAEDRKFYEHGGIDVKGIMRAVFVNVTTFDPTGQGASTITQQLVKNAILTTEKSYIRKIKEIVLALALERRYSKDEILQLYLNEIPYGSTNYGVESASRTYLGKHVKDLNLAEAATIAALPQAPSRFLNDPESLKQRRDWILRSMAELGYITAEERDAALAEETPIDFKISGLEAPHFVLWIKEQLEEKYGQRTVEQGGLTVVTTIDFDKQKIAEEAVENNRLARAESYGFNNSGLVALDPKTGQILSMVGSVDYFDDEIDGQVNVTTRPLQPGSSFKPIVYAAAFEKGYTPNTILWDAVTTFQTATGPYTPKNYDLKEHGPVSVRTALQGSLNIPAVKMVYLVGVDNALNFAERLHYSTFDDRSKFGLAIVLGGAEVKLLDHVAAYATFANEGVYHEPVTILKVTDGKGEILEEWQESEGEKVMEPNIARMISNVLSDNAARAYIFGASTNQTLPGRAVATKTGTTNDYKDAWTVGYTPSLVTGVWTGNTKGAAMKRGSGGSTVAAPIWHEFMSRVLSGTPVESFTAPTIPVTGIPVLDGQLPTQEITIDKASGKLATDRTPVRFRETKVCGQFHSILHYIDKNNPTKITETGSQNDAYYQDWEKGIQEYIVRRNAELKDGEAPMAECEIPTESDDLHVAANEPRVQIFTPSSDAEVGRDFVVQLSAEAPRGLSRIEYLIDNSFVKLDANSTGTTIVLPSWVGVGSHTLSAVAYDDIDNAGTAQINIRVNSEGSGAGLKITNPFDNQTIERVEPKYNLAVENTSSATLLNLIVKAQNLWNGQTIIITELTNPASVNAIEWTLPEPAQYLLEATAVTSSGSIINSSPIKVLITDPLPTTIDPALIGQTNTPGDATRSGQ